MDDAAAMRHLERAEQLRGKSHSELFGEWSMLAQQLAQIGSVDVLHD